MLAELERGGTCNRILRSLTNDDYDLIGEFLEPVQLAVHKKLEAPNKTLNSVYFMESGVAAILAAGPPDCSICIGIVGSEGVTGLPVIMGADRSPNETQVCLSGQAHQISANRLKSAMTQSPSLHAALLGYACAMNSQIAQTALANGWNTIEERLARLLCMAHDRSDTDELNITHERLGELLGVRRPAITLALARLEEDRAVQVRRGAILVVDRMQLEKQTAGAYGTAEREFERMFTPGGNGRFAQPHGMLDLQYYYDQRDKTQARVAAARGLCQKQRELLARIEVGGRVSSPGPMLLTTMETALELLRKSLVRIERAIDLERNRQAV